MFGDNQGRIKAEVKSAMAQGSAASEAPSGAGTQFVWHESVEGTYRF
jgi:hypothetical protein